MRHTEITSLKDERILLAKELRTLKGRLNKEKILIEGLEAINWAIQSGVGIDYILAGKSSSILHENDSSHKIYQISDGLLKKVTGTKYLIPEVAVAQIKNNAKHSDFIVILDNINDFGNLGTIVRTCNAFGIDTLISTNYEMDLYHKKTVDASRGRVFSTNLIKFRNSTEAVKYLRKNNFQVVTTSPHGNNIQSMVAFSGKPVALVIGNETHGVSDELLKNSDYIVQIPMQSCVESLNAGVAAGISMYELKLKQVIGMIEKKIKSTLGRDINVLAMLTQKVLDKKLRKVTPFSSQQLILMMVLTCDIVMTFENIQQQFGIPENELNDFLEPLIKERYVTMETEGSLSVTEAGVETIGKLWPLVENAEAEILKSFSHDEKEQLLALIRKMEESCITILHEK